MNETGIKKTMLISPEQDHRLKTYCKYNHISASQLFRFFIDELASMPFQTTLKDHIQTNALRVHTFVAPTTEAPLKEIISDGQGNTRTQWWNKKNVFNSWPQRG